MLDSGWKFSGVVICDGCNSGGDVDNVIWEELSYFGICDGNNGSWGHGAMNAVALLRCGARGGGSYHSICDEGDSGGGNCDNGDYRSWSFAFNHLKAI